jgi:hypothetical protein
MVGDHGRPPIPAAAGCKAIRKRYKVESQKAQPTRPAKEIKTGTIKRTKPGESAVGNGVPVVVE